MNGIDFVLMKDSPFKSVCVCVCQKVFCIGDNCSWKIATGLLSVYVCVCVCMCVCCYSVLGNFLHDTQLLDFRVCVCVCVHLSLQIQYN